MGTPMQKISQFEAERRQRQIFIGLESKKRKERRIIFFKGFITGVSSLSFFAMVIIIIQSMP